MPVAWYLDEFMWRGRHGTTGEQAFSRTSDCLSLHGFYLKHTFIFYFYHYYYYNYENLLNPVDRYLTQHGCKY